MGSYLVRDAHLLTLDGADAGLETGDILIEGRRIVDVGRSLPANGAESIDGRGMIAMPGLIDSHRHCWGSIMRGGACYGNLGDYFAKNVFTYGAAFSPEDNYTSIRFGMAEAGDSGITAVHTARSEFGAHSVELDPVDERVLVDRPRVRGAVTQGFAVELAGSADVRLGDRREREKLDGVDLDQTGADAVAAALLDLWPLPQADGQRDIAGQDVIAQLAAELHTPGR